MDQSFISSTLWSNDSKFLHHNGPDFFTSVQVTQDVPTGVSFGPCVLHNTFYDTIAFIALKSFDRRGKSYVFRVDPDALKSSPLVVPWLRLVQAAMDAEEQNTEAYVKAGQLYFRTIRDISQGEELLVWYDEELSHLLGFSDIKTRVRTDGLSCVRCEQAFKNLYPFLAHCRFLCAGRAESEQTHEGVKRQVTDFHNIARDMEQNSGAPEDFLANRKRKHDGSPRRKSVLLERKNMTNMTPINPDLYAHDLEQSTKVTDDRWSTSRLKSDKNSAFAVIKKATGTKLGQIDYTDLQPHAPVSRDDYVRSNSVLLWSTHAQQKSAFCKPSKRTTTKEHHPVLPLCGPKELSEDGSDYSNLLASHLQSDLPSIQATAQITTAGSFHYAPDPWCRSITGPVLPSSSSLPLLPPTLSSLGVSMQNWCAKCNLSFRMTSDLVFHMRSHHKKEFAAEAQGRRRREEKLTCPICHEYFRERHHLSRHMTSHN